MSKTTENEGQVTGQLRELGEQVNRLRNIREPLLDRLRIVTRDEPPLERTEEQEPIQELVPMANDVRTLVDLMAVECTFLESLLCKLEV